MHELDKTGLEAAISAATDLTIDGGVSVPDYVSGIISAYLSSTSKGVTEEQAPASNIGLAIAVRYLKGAPGVYLAKEISDAIKAERQAALEASRVDAPARVTDYWHSVDTAPEDEWVILATSGEHVGQALMLVDEDTGQQAWSWYGGDPVHPNLKPLGWRHMPSPLFTEILPDNRPGGFDGPTGAE